MIEYENLREVNRPFFEEYQRSFDKVLESGWYILGNCVQEFEEKFASYIGATYCTGVASGLDALYLSLKAFNFKEGSEVIVPSNTYIATILSVLNNNLNPVLAEPDISTYNIDPLEVEKRITPLTRAVIVVHLYGKPCDMQPIMEICRKHDLRLIEDCAQSHGAVYKGKRTGTFGDFGAFSFYPTKNLGALGDAGAVLTDDEKLAEKIKKLRNYGSTVKYYNDLIGINSRLDEVQAAFLAVKLKRLDDIIAHKRTLANIYMNNLKDDFIKPVVHADYFDVYHIFSVRCAKRDSLRDYLLKNSIKTEVHYPVPPHRQKAMEGILNGHYPISEEIHDTVLSLPISYCHTRDDIYRVVEVMNKF